MIRQADAVPSPLQPFQPGEILIYDISWSKMVKAGTAVMEVREQPLPDGKHALSFILIGRSVGMVDRFFSVNDRIQSVFDPVSLQSLRYNSWENFGRKKRNRSLVFDRTMNTVVAKQDDGPAQTSTVPAQVQDALASFYYLRTRNDFTVGKVFFIDVYDSGKNWSIEVHTLGRERVSTPAGVFNTIVLKTRPLSEGVFQNKGEMFIWLTDDRRKVPVLMKSTLKIGSFIFSLKAMIPGIAPTKQADRLPALDISMADGN